MRAPTHIQPLDDFNQTARSHPWTPGRSVTPATEAALLKSALAADLCRHRSRQCLERRVTGWERHRSSLAREPAVRRFVGSRRHLRLALMFSALFHQSSHSGFRRVEFSAFFPIAAVHIHPEMVFASSYSIYRRSLNG